MHMKKITMFLCCIVWAQCLCAQTMTDEQVKAFVVEAQGKGLSKQEIAKDLKISNALDVVKTEILSGAGRDYCASRGEYLAAVIMAEV